MTPASSTILLSIPEGTGIIVGALIAGVLAAGVAWIQQRGETNRLNIQLANARELHVDDRENNLKREIFFQVIEALTKSLEIIQDLGKDNPTLSVDSIISSALGKLKLVANKETLIAVENFGIEINRIFSEILPQALENASLLIDKNLAHDEFNSDIAEFNKLGEELRACRLKGELTTPQGKILQEEYTESFKKQNESYEDFKSKNEISAKKAIEITALIVKHLQELTPSYNRAIFFMRQELVQANRISEEDFLTIFDTTMMNLEETTSSMINTATKRITDTHEENP